MNWLAVILIACFIFGMLSAHFLAKKDTHIETNEPDNLWDFDE